MCVFMDIRVTFRALHVQVSVKCWYTHPDIADCKIPAEKHHICVCGEHSSLQGGWSGQTSPRLLWNVEKIILTHALLVCWLCVCVCALSFWLIVIRFSRPVCWSTSREANCSFQPCPQVRSIINIPAHLYRRPSTSSVCWWRFHAVRPKKCKGTVGLAPWPWFLPLLSNPPL